MVFVTMVRMTTLIASPCVHHWKIDGSNLGECRHCGEVRQFAPWKWNREREKLSPRAWAALQKPMRAISTPPKNDNEPVYTDKGCEISPSCLRCPRDRCIFDEPSSVARTR